MKEINPIRAKGDHVSGAPPWIHQVQCSVLIGTAILDLDSLLLQLFSFVSTLVGTLTACCKVVKPDSSFCFYTIQVMILNDHVSVHVVGELLKRPVDLIDPNSDLATLYSLDDSRFPLSNSEYSSTETLFLLRQLGMATDSISWEVSGAGRFT